MYEFKGLIRSRDNRKDAVDAFAAELTRMAKSGWYPFKTEMDYTPMYPGGQRQQYIWTAIMSREVPDAQEG